MEVESIPQDIKPAHTTLNGFRGAQNGSPAHTLESKFESSNQTDANGDLESGYNEGNERPLPSLEDLERELPQIDDGQIHLGYLMHQLVQDLYAQLLNVAETIGRAPDSVKKAKLQAWLSHAHKQTSKLYVLTKYSRNASDIQKAMNIAAFLRTQGEQIIWATKALHTVQDELNHLRIRNPDLLTALDVLTTGTYTRLPSKYIEEFVPRPKMSDKEVADVFAQVEDLMRMRLLCRDVVPVEMRRWRIEGGRTFFTVPKRFETSLIMTGAQKDDVWAFVHVEFLFGLPEGERKGSREFPRRPPKAFSDDLAFQVRDIIMAPTLLNDHLQSQNIPIVPLTSAVVDAPLVRVYNFLQLLSLTYQLEILIFQAAQLQEYGWKDYLRLRVALDRRSLTVQYWVRPPPNSHGPVHLQNSIFFGGEITISVSPVTAASTSSSLHSQLASSAGQPMLSQRNLPSRQYPGLQSDGSTASNTGSSRTPIDRIKAQMQERLKLRGGGRPSDEVEQHRFEVIWKPTPGALGVLLAPNEIDTTGLEVDSDCLDFEGLLKKVLRRHADAIMAKHLEKAQSPGMMQLFPHPEDVRHVEHSDGAAIRVQLAGEQHIVVTIEHQTGRFLLCESGDLGASVRGVRWKACQIKINQEPSTLLDLCARLRCGAILELVEGRANLLGITTYRHRFLVPSSVQKFGKHYGVLFCQLRMLPHHYVAILVTDGGFKFALVEMKKREMEFGMPTGEMVINDFAWVQAEKFLAIGAIDEGADSADDDNEDAGMDDLAGADYQGNMGTTNGNAASRKRKRSVNDVGMKLATEPLPTSPKDPFDISIRELRDLHAYCRVRVAHIHIENQLKNRSIPYVHVRSQKLLADGQPRPIHAAKGSLKETIATLKSPFLPYLPVLCVQSSDLLAGAAAAEAAMPNIRIEPTEWWTLDKECMVNTSVQLKYVQPLDDGGSSRAGASSRGRNGRDGAMITPSENISYDPQTSVITFLSRKVEHCVDEFLTEWARVSKVVVIARQVSLMPTVKNWKDVRILSFDLQTVEFAYYQDYAVSVTSVEGNYKLSFFRCSLPSSSQPEDAKTSPAYGSSMDIDGPSLPPSQSQGMSQPPPPPSQTTPSQSQSSQTQTNQAGTKNDPTRRNAHEDIAHFAQELLKDERLGPSVFEMVGFLRSTVGVVEILDSIEERVDFSPGVPGKDGAKGSSLQFDVLVKAAGWWRIQYSAMPTLKGGSKHGLDIRILGGKVMIVDGSVNLHAGKDLPKSREGGALVAIPKMPELVKAALEEAKDLPGDGDGIVAVNYGDAVICGSRGAPKIVGRLHEKILEVL